MQRCSFAILAILAALLPVGAGGAGAETVLHISLDVKPTANGPQWGNNPRLYVLENDEVTASYPIAAPTKKDTSRCILRGATVNGQIQKVNYRASWYPPESIRREARRKGKSLKTKYGPDDPGNALGGMKLEIEWETCLPNTIRVHATPNRRSVEEQQRASHGCIRTLPEYWLAVAERVAKGTQVVVSGLPPYVQQNRLE